MTENEERQRRAMALLEYQEAKQALILLQVEARQIAENLKGLAKLLIDSPELIDQPEGDMSSYKTIFELAGKLTQASYDVTERKRIVEELGMV